MCPTSRQSDPPPSPSDLSNQVEQPNHPPPILDPSNQVDQPHGPEEPSKVAEISVLNNEQVLRSTMFNSIVQLIDGILELAGFSTISMHRQSLLSKFQQIAWL
ncbi:hypothetical protein BCON_0315g00030 [Botryotinia convoluta]|uniref:Uncharacterized protein n=1 Tax=Botryotinia convoluta TaxID=54673 RepID=A0A4Z1HCU7_9HELO|nr:hypothetical protein BCON_0315g00030 [Botryotinia convoluta]